MVRHTVAVREVSRTLWHGFTSQEATFKHWRDIFSLAYYCDRDAFIGMRNLQSKSRKEDVTRNAFKKLEGLHLPSLLQKACAHMNLKESTIHSTQTYIDTLITEQWVTFHLDHPDNKDFVNQTTGMRRFRSFSARRLAHSTGCTAVCTAADPKIRAEVGALGKTQLKIGLGNCGYLEDAKISKYGSP